MSRGKPVAVHGRGAPRRVNGFQGNQPVQVHVDLDKYVDQRVDARFSEKENEVWRSLWKFIFGAIGGSGVITLLINLLFQ